MIDQVRFVDLDEYFRTGGVDWDALQLNFPGGCIIRAGLGYNQDDCMVEYITEAKRRGIPYATYYFYDPDLGRTPQEQIDTYLSWYGVKGHFSFMDAEPPRTGTRNVNRAELEACIKLLKKAGQKAGVYSSENLLRHLYPRALPDNMRVPFWMARYPYAPGTSDQYKYYEPFMQNWEGQKPPPADSIFAPYIVGWQFTANGDAQHYCANEFTNHPRWTRGKLSCCLNVSTVSKLAWEAIIGAPIVTPPIPEPPPVIPPPQPQEYQVRVSTGVLNLRAGPGASFADLGDLVNTSVLTVDEQRIGVDGQMWLHVKDGWVAGWLVNKLP